MPPSLPRRLLRLLAIAPLWLAPAVALAGPPTGETPAPATQPATQPAGRVVIEKPITVRVTQIADRPNRGVVGLLLEYDEEGLTLEVSGQPLDFRWIEITPHSAFILRYRLIDQASAGDWLDLGEFAWEIGAGTEAERALRTALKLDPSLAEKVDRIRATAPGKLRGPFQEKEDEERATGEPEAPRELLTAVEALQLFEPVTEEQARQAASRADEAAQRSLSKLGISYRRLETDHFVVYTDWDPVDDDFLRDSLAAAYRLVAGEFGMPQDQNIFVGRLPVYMFDSADTFLRYAHEIDRQKGFGDAVGGYYSGFSNGQGKLVMSKPRRTERLSLELARQLWRRNLTHEFAHAFFARYRSNAFVPRWLNEGVAEVIADKVYPRHGALETARRIARTNRSIGEIFDDRRMPGPEMYPVMMTLVQALWDEDPQRFVQYIDRIKSGEHAERLLEELYDVDYRGLEASWRRMMLRK